MKSIFKLFGLFTVIILILSITFKRKTVFEHIYSLISPATRSAQTATEKFFSYSVDSTEKFGKKLFNNSSPRFKDSIKSKFAAPERIKGIPQDEIPFEDKEELDQLIKSH